jgi:hypothetical protein
MRTTNMIMGFNEEACEFMASMEAPESVYSSIHCPIIICKNMILK